MYEKFVLFGVTFSLVNLISWLLVDEAQLTVCPVFWIECRKYSNVRKWTLGLIGGKDQIAVIRASGSISRTRSPLSVSGSGIIGEQLIEKIRSVRGT